MFGVASFLHWGAGRRLAAVLGAATLSLVLVAPASAAATITRETITTYFSETGIPDDCRPGITGTIVDTLVSSYQSVETPQGFHIAGTGSSTGRIDWSDGTYSIIESVDHFSFNAVGKAMVFTTAYDDSANTYTADGVFLFRGTFHFVKHFTVTDGVVRVDFERSRLHFFGSC